MPRRRGKPMFVLFKHSHSHCRRLIFFLMQGGSFQRLTLWEVRWLLVVVSDKQTKMGGSWTGKEERKESVIRFQCFQNEVCKACIVVFVLSRWFPHHHHYRDQDHETWKARFLVKSLILSGINFAIRFNHEFSHRMINQKQRGKLAISCERRNMIVGRNGKGKERGSRAVSRCAFVVADQTTSNHRCRCRHCRRHHDSVNLEAHSRWLVSWFRWNFLFAFWFVMLVWWLTWLDDDDDSTRGWLRLSGRRRRRRCSVLDGVESFVLCPWLP